MKKNLQARKIVGKKLQELADVMKLLGDLNRLKIAILCLEGSVCVSDIAKQTELSQSLVSHHLRLLRTARLVKSERKGRNVHYVINDDHIRCVLVDMIDHVLEK
ncbi:MAG TPA: transcriptional regulator [Rhodospirillaceae bacterium]|nr:transcriptional regulator [Rhodospirillaceae bacterium]